MKILTSIALLCLVAGCSQPSKESVSMPGAYKMLYQKIKGGKTDTSYTSLLQQKIYTGDYMMYSNFNPPDSSTNFGIGTYDKTADTVIEKVFYNGSDSTMTDTKRNFKLVISKTDAGYMQVIPEIESQGEKFILTEEYENVGKAVTSPLDGAWKLDKVIYTKGKDSTMPKVTQFKAYWAGHFTWGHTYTDSTNKIHTGIGYGTFTLEGTDKLKETVIVSSYAEIRGSVIDIAVEMTGADAFKQTIVDKKDSSKQIEYYTRLKK